MSLTYIGAAGDKVRPKDCAFTLIELLVVIAIIAILAALLLPVLSRESQGHGYPVSWNLKQLQLAWQMNVNDHNDFIPGNNWWMEAGSNGMAAAR